LRGEGEGEGVEIILHPPLNPLPSREGKFRIPRSLLRGSSFIVRKMLTEYGKDLQIHRINAIF
jgi:hypothetical protein